MCACVDGCLYCRQVLADEKILGANESLGTYVWVVCRD